MRNISGLSQADESVPSRRSMGARIGEATAASGPRLEDGPPSGAATADGAEPITNTAEETANTDVIVSLLRNMMKSPS